MKNIPEYVLKEFNSNNPQYSIQVLLYVAYWNAATRRVENKNEAIDITNSILKYGKFSYKLDTTEFDKWEASSGSLTVTNTKAEWNEGSKDSFFKDREYVYKSKIVVRFGTPTFKTNIFTGYLSKSPVYNSEEQTCELKIFSEMDMLDTFNAEKANAFDSYLNNSTTWGNTTNLGDNLNFTTDKNSVGIVGVVATYSSTTGVYTTLQPSKDYSVSDLNIAGSPAKITLKNPLSSGLVLRWKGVQWYVEQDFDFLINKLLDVANVRDREVQPAVFENDAKAYFLTSQINSIFNNSNMWHTQPNNDLNRINKPSFAYVPSFTNNTFSYSRIDGNYGNYNCGAYNIYSGNGTYSFLYHGSAFMTYMGVGIATNTYDSDRWNGYGFIFSATNNTLRWSFSRITNGIWASGTGAVLASGTLSDRRVNHKFSFSLKDSIFNLFIDGSKIATFRDGTYSRFKYFSVGAGNDVYSGYGTNISDIKYSKKVMTDYSQYNAVFSDSEIFQKPKASLYINSVNSNMSLWDTINYTVTNPNNITISYLLRKSYDNITWTRFQIFSDGEDIGFDGNYLEFAVLYDISALTTSQLTIVITNISYLIKTGIKINIANFTRLSVLDAIEQIATMCSYEIGFDSEGKFFFRKRNIEAIIGELTKKEVKRTSSAEIDYANLYTKVEVKFGEYSRIVDDSASPSPNIIDIYGERTKSVSSDNLLPASNVDLAYAIAPTVYANVKTLRRKLKIRTQFLLQAELGDSFNLKYLPNNKRFEAMTEDEKVQALFTYNRVYRIQGIDIDLSKKELSLELKS